MSWWNRDRVQLPGELYQRAQEHAAQAGYASLAEFIEHCVRKELEGRGSPDKPDDELLQARLRGLGYVE